jgi:hypothetical protein
MAVVNKIDSNVTGLRYAEEASLGVLPGSPVWVPLEPNEYDDFGGEITTVARNPINPSRQRKKGVTVDLDAEGGFQTDLTQENLQDLLQGFMFADLREKAKVGGASEITGIAGSVISTTDTTGIAAGDLIIGRNFGESGNNDVLWSVASVIASTSITINETPVAEGAPPATAEIRVVGIEGTAGDIDVDVSGTYPALTTTTIDWTTEGLVEGEWIFIGGDGAGESFANAVNNGWKRIRSIAANTLTLDKSDSTMVTEASTTETVRIFYGRVLKNETGSLITRRSYNLERTLGAPDDSLPAQVQAEYIEGAVPSEFTMSIPTADKLTCELAFIGTNSSTVDGPTALKSGSRPALTESDAFNTSSDFSRINLAQVVDGNEAPTPLFAFAQEIEITINNNLSPNKAIGTLGSFEVTAGTFEVSGDITAYFADVAAITAVRNNVDITLDFAIAKANAGMVFDLPLISLGEGRPEVEQDEPITLPLSMDAATAAKIDPNLDYTAMFVFFDYLPTAAE